jgi:hypothetical protein
MVDCKKCEHYILNPAKPRISRCGSRHPGMVIDNEILLMATEGRLPENVCGPTGRLFREKKHK